MNRILRMMDCIVFRLTLRWDRFTKTHWTEGSA